METPEKRTNAPEEHETSSDPLDDLEIPSDADREIDEIDDTAILNELLRDLSPELLEQDDSAKDEPEQAAVSEPEPPAPEPVKPAPVAETPAEPEKAEEPAEEDTGSWLFDDSLDEQLAESESEVEEAPAEEEVRAPEPEPEPTPEPPVVEKSAPEKEESGSWLFDEEPEKESAEPAAEEAKGTFDAQSVDDAFAALDMTEDEPEEQEAEPEAVEAADETSKGSGLFDTSALDEAFAGFGEDAAPEEPATIEAAQEEPAVEEVAEAAALSVPVAPVADEPPPVVDAIAGTEDIENQLASSIALHFLERLEASMASPAAPIAEKAEEPEPVKPAAVAESEVEPVESVVEDEEPALTADIEDDFIVADDEPEAAEEPAVAEELPDIDKLLTDDFEADDEIETPIEEPSLDDLVTTAVLNEEEPEPVPVYDDSGSAELDGEGGAEPSPGMAPSVAGDDDELDQLIEEMKKRQKRRRIITGAIAAVVVAGFIFLMTRPSDTGDDEVAAVPAEQSELIEQQAADDQMAGDAVASETPATETPTPAPIPRRTPPVTSAGRTPIQDLAETAAQRTPPPPPPRTTVSAPTKPPSSPSGIYTVHSSSYKSMTNADIGRETWGRRGFDYIVVWPWVNPRTGEQWYRLGVGRYTSREDAQKAKDYLVSKGYLSADDWAPLTRIPEGAR